ncbi:STAS domain-containing protein [Virgibacillus sp. MSJ-26]|uniref:STAS domain-containing protein n=1 Tax=Virgibacillus sp. MSJ-26 TaxID=2841522 RepID=UPI001C10AEFF|nr:STAS domain-containing protein [Virgibacillus sp. MSJ-26]MBU5468547.1 STAS domain-containing protein [Virgibacillus sp. MSJ-26]
MNLSIDIVEEKSQMIVYVSGEVDIYTAPDLKKEVLKLTAQKGNAVIIDLSDVNYMDSTGIGVFISALKSTKENDSRLKLVNLQSSVMRLFEITGLIEIIDIQPEIRGVSE